MATEAQKCFLRTLGYTGDCDVLCKAEASVVITRLKHIRSMTLPSVGVFKKMWEERVLYW